MPKVSVLIPIYNVEKYISRCARSLFEQTLQDIEFIFVNDCTSDNSLYVLNEVIKCYPYRKNQIKIINHSQNKGLAAARNTGIANACGDYIIHCDSDDWVDPEMYEELYTKAVKDNSDIVTCDLWKERPHYRKYVKQDFKSDPHEYIKSILNKKSHGSNCTKLIKRSFFVNHHLKFIEGLNMWEDLLMATKTFFFADKISYINKAFYHYEKNNPDSLITCFSENSLNQLVSVSQEIERFYKEYDSLEKFQDDINNLKLFIKYLHFRKGNKKMSKKAIPLYNYLNNSIFSSSLKATRKVKLWTIVHLPLSLPVLKRI